MNRGGYFYTILLMIRTGNVAIESGIYINRPGFEDQIRIRFGKAFSDQFRIFRDREGMNHKRPKKIKNLNNINISL